MVKTAIDLVMQIKTSCRLRSYRITEHETGQARSFCSLLTKFKWPNSELKFIISTSLIFFTIISFLPFNRPVQAEERDIILEESGIRYPSGFDANTAGEVSGKAVHFFRPETGPVRFKLVTNRETYTVLTSPSWYWDEIQGKASEGTEVLVRGSKSVGKDGNLYIVAQDIKIVSSGNSLIFRDKSGTPLWKNTPWPERGTPGGFGPSPGGRGGFGAGGGSRGRGRR